MPKEPVKPEEAPLPEKVSCRICHREIPRSDAIKDEGDDYILWFCGFDCYHQWQQEPGEKDH